MNFHSVFFFVAYLSPTCRRQFHVIKRPHLHYFLRQAAKRYEVVLFTAGLREYADPLINLLDQKRDIFSSRYFREVRQLSTVLPAQFLTSFQSCVNRGGYFVKDLTKIDVDLRNGFLVDNSEISYSLQKGSPVRSCSEMLRN
jgi:TFIIF-interacting CTD phosphatase-like protein